MTLGYLPRKTRDRPVTKDDVEAALQREVIPAVAQLERYVNDLRAGIGVDDVISESGPARADSRLTLVDASGGPVTVLLSDAQKAVHTVKKTDASANVVTVAAASGLIDGAATYPLTAQYQAVRLDFDGSDYWVV